MHFGIIGMKWGVRRFQNKNGTWTAAGKARRAEVDEAPKQNSKTYDDYKAGHQRKYEDTREKLIKALEKPRGRDDISDVAKIAREEERLCHITDELHHNPKAWTDPESAAKQASKDFDELMAERGDTPEAYFRRFHFYDENEHRWYGDY